MISLLLMATTIAPAVPDRNVVMTGSHKALIKYAEALVECGFQGARVQVGRDGQEFVDKPELDSSVDEQEAAACEMLWAMDHDKKYPLRSIEAPPAKP